MLNFKRIQFGFLAFLSIFVLGNIRSLAFAQGRCGPFPTLASDRTNGPQWDNSIIQIIIDENDLEADGTLLRGNCVDVKLDSSNWGHPIYHWTLSGTDFHFTTTTGPTVTTTDSDLDTVLVCAGSSACGSATITVVDSKEGNDPANDTDYVRCSTGDWVFAGSVSPNRGRSGQAWNCSCGDYWGYTGCETHSGITWHGSCSGGTGFEGKAGPLTGYSDSLYYMGRTGHLYWCAYENDLENVCNVDAHDCTDSPYDWTWDGSVEGQVPAGGDPGSWSDTLSGCVTGAYDDFCGSGYSCDCPGDRINATAYAYKWICD
jgi:hypothetical protein